MSTIIKLAPEWNNSHRFLDNVDYIIPGWSILPEKFKSLWDEYKPFVNIAVDEKNDIISLEPCDEIVFPSLPETDKGSILDYEKNYAIQLFVLSVENEEEMLKLSNLYPEYKVGKVYKTKDKFRYGTNSVGDPQLYQVLQDHTSSEEHTPDTATGLYKKIGIADDGTPIWVQPLGATDVYKKNDVVAHKERIWESEIDNNVWEPGVYGWKDITEQEPEIPEWKKPSGAHDAYNIGNQVRFEGHIYESLINGNTYSPTEYPDGWKLIK